MACEKDNNSSNIIMRNLFGSQLSNDLAANDPVFCNWASSQANMCSYSMNSIDQLAMEEQVTGSHQAQDMPDMPRGICEDNTQSSLRTLSEAPTAKYCTEWEHHEEKSRIVTDSNIILLGKDDLDPPYADDDLQQLEEYVNELVPALHMVNKSTHNMNIAHRQEAFKLTADARLVRRSTGMAWSDALSKRVSNKLPQELESIDNMGDPDYITPMECTSSSCIRTPVSSEGTNYSCDDFSAFHHESTASLLCSDHSSMVDSTSELLQDDMDVLNYVQSGAPLPLMDILSSSDAHMSSVNSSAELLSMCKQGENEEVKSESQLHAAYEEINARLALIRGCCKEDAKRSSNSVIRRKQAAAREEHVCNIISSYISPKEHVFHCNPCNDTPTDVKDYHLMSHDYCVSHAGEGTKSLHDAPCQRADLAPSAPACYDLASVSQLPSAGEDNENVTACSDADVARKIIHIPYDLAFKIADVAQCNSAALLGNADVKAGDMTGLQGMQMHDKVSLDDVADEVDVQEADVERVTWQRSNMKQYRTTKNDVADEVANGGHVRAAVEEGLRWKQGLTWQGSMNLATRDDMAGDVVYSADLDAGVGGEVRRGSHGGMNFKTREMMYTVAAYQPIDWENIMEEVVGKARPKRRNVRISKEPQSVAARRRRERISERIRILQHLVPGASKLDTAAMLDEAIHYLKFLKLQVQALRGIDKFTSQLPLSMTAPHI